MSRSLYECCHAKVNEKCIHCEKGHRLPISSIEPLKRGAPLVYQVCQKCPDFSRIGRPLMPNLRGWS